VEEEDGKGQELQVLEDELLELRRELKTKQEDVEKARVNCLNWEREEKAAEFKVKQKVIELQLRETQVNDLKKQAVCLTKDEADLNRRVQEKEDEVDALSARIKELVEQQRLVSNESAFARSELDILRGRSDVVGRSGLVGGSDVMGYSKGWLNWGPCNACKRLHDAERLGDSKSVGGLSAASTSGCSTPETPRGGLKKSSSTQSLSPPKRRPWY